MQSQRAKRSNNFLTECLTNEFTQCSKFIANIQKVYDIIMFTKVFLNFSVFVVIFVNLYLNFIIERPHPLDCSLNIKVATDIT